MEEGSYSSSSGDDDSSDSDYRREARTKHHNDPIDGRKEDESHEGEAPVEVRGQGLNIDKPKLRSRVMLSKMIKLVKKFGNRHVDLMKGSVLEPVLSYPGLEMDRHIAHALVRAWVPHERAFRLGSSLVKFTVYDVAFMTGLPMSGDKVRLDLKETYAEFGNEIRIRAKEIGERKKNDGDIASDSRPSYCLKATRQLCKSSLNAQDGEKFRKMFAFYLFGAILFPKTPGKAAWGLELYADEADIGKYAWADAVWQYIVDGLDEMTVKIRTAPKEVGVQGFSILLQCWFYEHSKRLSTEAPKVFPRILRWVKAKRDLPTGRRVYALVESFPGDEIVPVLKPMEHEISENIVKGFIETEEWKKHVVEAEEYLSRDEQARRVRERLLECKKKLKTTTKQFSIAEARKEELEEEVKRLKEENELLRSKTTSTMHGECQVVENAVDGSIYNSQEATTALDENSFPPGAEYTFGQNNITWKQGGLSQDERPVEEETIGTAERSDPVGPVLNEEPVVQLMELHDVPLQEVENIPKSSVAGQIKKLKRNASHSSCLKYTTDPNHHIARRCRHKKNVAIGEGVGENNSS